MFNINEDIDIENLYEQNAQVENDRHAINFETEFLQHDLDKQNIYNLDESKDYIEILEQNHFLKQQPTKTFSLLSIKVKQIEFSQDQKHLIVLYNNGSINIYETEKYQLQITFLNLNCQCFTTDMENIYLGIKKQIKSLNLKNFKLNANTNISLSQNILQIQISNINRLIAAASIQEIYINKNKIYCQKFLFMQFCPFEKFFIYVQIDFQIIVLDTKNFEQILTINLDFKPLNALDDSFSKGKSDKKTQENISKTVCTLDYFEDSIVQVIEEIQTINSYRNMLQISDCGKYIAVFQNKKFKVLNDKFEQVSDVMIVDNLIQNIVFDQDQIIVYIIQKIYIYDLKDLKLIQTIDQPNYIQNLLIFKNKQKIQIQINQKLYSLQRNYQRSLHLIQELPLFQQFDTINNLKVCKDFIIMTTSDGFIYAYEKYLFRLINVYHVFQPILKLQVSKTKNAFMIQTDLLQIFKIQNHKIVLNLKKQLNDDDFVIFDDDQIIMIKQNGDLKMIKFNGQVKLYQIQDLPQIQSTYFLNPYLVIVSQNQSLQIYKYEFKEFKLEYNIQIDQQIQNVLMIKQQLYFFGENKIFKHEQEEDIDLRYQDKYLDNQEGCFLIEKLNEQKMIYNSQYQSFTQENEITNPQFIDQNTIIYQQQKKIQVSTLIKGNQSQIKIQQFFINQKNRLNKIYNLKDEYTQMYTFFYCLINFISITLNIVSFQQYLRNHSGYFETSLIILLLPIILFCVICSFQCFYFRNQNQFNNCLIQFMFITFIYFGFSPMMAYHFAQFQEFECKQCQSALDQDKANIVMKLKKQTNKRNINFNNISKIILILGIQKDSLNQTNNNLRSYNLFQIYRNWNDNSISNNLVGLHI